MSDPFVLSTLKAPLETCLRNLVGNAVKHHDRTDGQVLISSSEDGEYYSFEVKDDGPGIESKFQERIFKMFQTLKANSDEGAGSGIGLAIVKKTVDAYGGKIEVASEPGRGSRFRVSWPKAISDPAGLNF